MSLKRTMFLIAAFCLSYNVTAQNLHKEYYQLKLYHTKSPEQISKVDDYLKNAYLPALHKQGIKNIGVFKPTGIDTLSDKIIYVLIAFSSLDQWQKTESKIAADKTFTSAAESFNKAKSVEAPFERVESILLEAFTDQPKLIPPGLNKSERVFELRSYESPTAF